VTHIGERRAETGGRTATPRPLPRLDGSLALRTGPASTDPASTDHAPADSSASPLPGSRPDPPRTPELRLVEGGAASSEVQAWAARFAQAVVEVLGGDRPLSQLVRWTSHRVYLELERRLALLTRTSDSGRRRRAARPQVRSVHVCHPTAESAEVSVHVRYGRRSRAIAARLELVRGRWQCTVLQLG